MHPFDFSRCDLLDVARSPVKHAGNPPSDCSARLCARGKAVVINESADLFEAPSSSSRRQAVLGDDLMAVLAGRVERLVDRQRATQRAVSELREAVAARDRRIVELDAKLAASERARDELVARIDGLIERVDELIAASDTGAEAAE